MTTRAAWIFALGVAFASGLEAADPAVSTSYDVPYTTAGGTELRLDIAQPAMGDGPFPAVLVIHGGAWHEGGREENHRAIADFARHGYVGVSPQYRFCPKDVFPAQLDDMKAALKFLRANAGELKIDPARIGAMGFSAGGHLALMLGLAVPRGEGVAAVVDFHGPTDLAAKDFSEEARAFVACLIGAPAAEKPELAAKASPVTWVNAGDAPVLVFQGASDKLVPPTQAFALMAKLSAAGVSGRVEFLLGAEHGWKGEEWDRTWKETIEFFDAHLKDKR